MQQSGFASTPITKSLLTLLLLNSFLASLTSSKPYFHLQVRPHLLPERQLHRIPLFQSLYANSGELLFACLLLYHLRLVERAFGSRKFLSCILHCWAVTSIIIPVLLLIGNWVTGGKWNYVPPGPTPTLFAVLAQFHAVVPAVYRFAVKVPGLEGQNGELAATDKAWTYVLAFQLAAGQIPGSGIAATVGWVVGYMWRLELLPGTKWRVHRRVVELLGGDIEGRELQVLRERLRREEGVDGAGAGQTEERRPLVSRVLDTFRGGF